MKKWIWGFVVGAFLAGAAPGMAEDVFRIEIGRRDSSRNSDRELYRRIYDLERAVEQLQRKVFKLELGNANPPAASMTTCYLKTPFDGTFSATEATETAARAKVLEKCTKASSETFCQERNLKCGK